MAHVQVVYNEKSIRNTVSEFIKQAGFLVDTAKNADEALELLTAAKYDQFFRRLFSSRYFIHSAGCTPRFSSFSFDKFISSSLARAFAM